jgi:hypothetical protein
MFSASRNVLGIKYKGMESSWLERFALVVDGGLDLLQQWLRVTYWPL